MSETAAEDRAQVARALLDLASLWAPDEDSLELLSTAVIGTRDELTDVDPSWYLTGGSLIRVLVNSLAEANGVDRDQVLFDLRQYVDDNRGKV